MIAAILLLAGSVVGRTAARRVIEQWYEPALAKVSARPPIVLQPATMKNMFDWMIDAAQLLAVLIAPAVGLVFFLDDLERSVALIYTVVLISGFIATLVFVMRVSPVNYGQKRLGWRIRGELRGVKKWRWLTPIAMVGAGFNLLAAIVAGILASVT